MASSHRLDASRSAPTHGHLVCLDDDRYRALAIAAGEHPLHVLRRGLDVDELDRGSFFFESLTGLRGVGSTVFSKYRH